MSLKIKKKKNSFLGRILIFW